MTDGKKVWLRPIEESDLETLARWMNDPEVIALTGPYDPVSAAKQRRWFEGLQTDSTRYVFAIETTDDGTLIGTCGLYNIHSSSRNAELRIRIGEKSAWGKGYGSESTELLAGFGFDDLNLHRIYLTAFAQNERAIRLYEKCGFSPEGLLKDHGFTQGQYRDVVFMGRVSSNSKAK